MNGSYGYDRDGGGDPLPKRFDKRYMWKTAKGEILRARDFYTEHLKNTVAMLERRNDEANDLEEIAWGEFDFMHNDFEKDVEERYPVYKRLVKELERREAKPKVRLNRKKTVESVPPQIDKIFWADSPVPIRVFVDGNKLGLQPLGEMYSPNGIGFHKSEFEDFVKEMTEILRKWM